MTWPRSSSVRSFSSVRAAEASAKALGRREGMQREFGSRHWKRPASVFVCAITSPFLW